MGGVFFPSFLIHRFDIDRASDTPVASLAICQSAFSRAIGYFEGRQDRFPHRLVKSDGFLGPRCLPSDGNRIPVPNLVSDDEVPIRPFFGIVISPPRPDSRRFFAHRGRPLPLGHVRHPMR